MAIPFTQYLRPTGEPKAIEIDRGPITEQHARECIRAGARFEAEVLTTGEVSFTCEKGDELLAHEITFNGPPVLAAVDRLIETAWEKLNSDSAERTDA